jgi:hypothetical protein
MLQRELTHFFLGGGYLVRYFEVDHDTFLPWETGVVENFLVGRSSFYQKHPAFCKQA